MPTYEYRCPDCGRDFERFQRMSDLPGAPCPDCGQAAERLISAGGGLLFKGDGFYITDYRSDAYKDKVKQDAGGEKTQNGGSEKEAASASGGVERGGNASEGARDKDARRGNDKPKRSEAGSKGSSDAGSGRSSSAGASQPKGKDGGERRGG